MGDEQAVDFAASDGIVRIYDLGTVWIRPDGGTWRGVIGRLTPAQRARVLARLPAELDILRAKKSGRWNLTDASAAPWDVSHAHHEARRVAKLGNWPPRVFRPLPEREAAVLRECL